MTNDDTGSTRRALGVAIVAATLLGLASAADAQGTFEVLHAFDPGSGAINPQAPLLQASDGNFYGTTFRGGAWGSGTIFRMTPAGKVTTLHEFTDDPDIRHPYGPLIQAIDGAFYGTTFRGAFKITPAGTLTVLHRFNFSTEGQEPYGGLTQGTDGNFYGPLAIGGPSGGAIFRMTPSGSVTILHKFRGGADGRVPQSPLIQAIDGNFYGTTLFGGDSSGVAPYHPPGNGTIFRMTPGGALTILHVFTAEVRARAALIQATDGSFYGVGGTGAAFRMTVGDTVNVNFLTGGDLVNAQVFQIRATNGNFYGTASIGGTSNLGTIFAMTPTGHRTVLHTFTGGIDGASPYSGLIQATDGNFYGTTDAGGMANAGTVFRMDPGGKVTVLHEFTHGASPHAPLIEATDGSFYGTTTADGIARSGTAFRMNTSGDITVLHAFGGGPAPGSDGAAPHSGLVQGTDGDFYGTTRLGGPINAGTVFRMTPSGAVTILHSFAGIFSQGALGADGAYPTGALVQGTDGDFYGTTSAGPSLFGAPWPDSGPGTIFKISSSGTFTLLHTFNGTTEGGSPRGALLQARDGNFYGTTLYGGNASCTNGCGTVFRMTPGGALTVLHAFTAGTDGANPYSGLIQGTDGNLYGTTLRGGGTGCTGTGCGTVFKITPTGAVTILHAFQAGRDGAWPYAALIQATDGCFYGTTLGGGEFIGEFRNYGTLFRMTPLGTVTILHVFNSLDGTYPAAPLIQAADGNLYGTTVSGRIPQTGIVFRFSPSESERGDFDGDGRRRNHRLPSVERGLACPRVRHELLDTDQLPVGRQHGSPRAGGLRRRPQDRHRRLSARHRQLVRAALDDQLDILHQLPMGHQHGHPRAGGLRRRRQDRHRHLPAG